MSQRRLCTNMRVHNLLAPLVLGLVASSCSAVLADDLQQHVVHRGVDWKSLHLNASQSQQLTQLENEWHAKYSRTQPQIAELQRKLERLLPDPKSDPLEIMATQQTIARLKEQLRNEATTNYLRKRSLLNEAQQHQLEGMLQQMVVERQRPATSALQGEQSPGIMNIVNKIKWAIEPH